MRTWRFLAEISLLVLLGGLFVIWHTVLSANSSTLTSKVIVGNSAPVVSAVTINHGNAITLTANATTSVVINYHVQDANGCSDVTYGYQLPGTSTAWRSGVASTCAVQSPTTSNLNCYLEITGPTDYTTSSCQSTTDFDVTSTVDIYYFADATDASSSYGPQSWGAFAMVTDAAGASSTATTTTYEELNTLNAISMNTSSINFGSVNANTNTGATNQQVLVHDAGNSSTTLQINAASTLASGSNSISTSSQHYASSTFTYGGGEQQLSATLTTVSGVTISPQIDTSNFALGWLTNANALPSAIDLHSAVVWNGYIYTVGGEDVNSTVTSTVFYAPINSTGSVGTWATTTALPSAIKGHSAVVYNGYIYTTGGFGSAVTSTVFYAPINSSGTVGAWNTTQALPSAIWFHSAVAYNGYIYTLGGCTASSCTGNVTSTVFYAPINSSGTVGTWQTTTALPSAIYEHSAVVYNGYIYTTGGGNGLITTSTVFYAPINSSGTVGTWQTTTALPSVINEHSAVVYNGYIYTIAGSGVRNNYYAPINSNGTVGAWATTAPLPSSPVIYLNSAVAYNGYLYTTGGIDNGSGLSTSTVFYSSLDVRPTYWGLAVPNGIASGTYTGTTVFTSNFSN